MVMMMVVVDLNINFSPPSSSKIYDRGGGDVGLLSSCLLLFGPFLLTPSSPCIPNGAWTGSAGVHNPTISASASRSHMDGRWGKQKVSRQARVE